MASTKITEMGAPPGRLRCEGIGKIGLRIGRGGQLCPVDAVAVRLGEEKPAPGIVTNQTDGSDRQLRIEAGRVDPTGSIVG